METRTKLEELIQVAMVDYGLNRVQQQSLIKWFLMVWFTLLRPCGMQSRGRSSLKITCVFLFCFVFLVEVEEDGQHYLCL